MSNRLQSDKGVIAAMALSWTRVYEQWGDARGVSETPGEAEAANLRPARMKERPFLLRRANAYIAMTGSRGAGKTVLYDALAGVTGGEWRPPGKSLDREGHKVLLTTEKGKARSSLSVIPGQDSQERREAEEQAFGPESLTNGVIHVVCWGRNKVWNAGTRDRMLNDVRSSGARVSLAEIIEINKKEELQNFKRVCDLLKDAWYGRNGVWLIIAVTKCDLFWEDLAEARDYYVPTSARRHTDDVDPARTAFARELEDLVSTLGKNTFKNLAVLPVSSYLDPYGFDGRVDEEKRSVLGDSQKDQLSRHFRAKVGEFCGL